MKTIKSIDGKSLLIGGLLVAIMFIGVAAKEAPKKAEQKYEYAWLFRNKTDLALGQILKVRDKKTQIVRLEDAPNFAWAASLGWEVCPSGKEFRNTGGVGEFYTLMRRPIK